MFLAVCLTVVSVGDTAISLLLGILSLVISPYPELVWVRANFIVHFIVNFIVNFA